MILVTYDLKQPGQRYSKLFEAIRSLGAYWHHLDSVWVIDTPLRPSQVYERLRPLIDDNDNLLIIVVDPNGLSGWLPQGAWAWFNTRNAAIRFR